MPSVEEEVKHDPEEEIKEEVEPYLIPQDDSEDMNSEEEVKGPAEDALFFGHD